jgi:UDP-N-acetylglucosamine 1-carboxyvinyltransferase
MDSSSLASDYSTTCWTSAVSSLTVAGPRDGLRGTVRVAGLKTASVPILASALTARCPIIVRNVPDLVDTRVMVDIAAMCGLPAVFNRDAHSIEIAAHDRLDSVVLDHPSMTTCHGPLYLLPALASLAEEVRWTVELGGCDIGQRPTKHIEEMISAVGHRVERWPGSVVVRRGFPCSIDADLRRLDDWWIMRSGATKAAIVATSPEGVGLHLRAPYVRSPVRELLRFSRLVWGRDTSMHNDELTASPGGPAQASEFTVPGDYLEALTWLCATAVATGDVTVAGFDPKACEPELDLLESTGAKLTRADDSVRIVVDGRLSARSFSTAEIDTDAQPLFGAVMALSRGSFAIEERIWPRRFGWVDSLRANGANLRLAAERHVEGSGVTRLGTADVVATDLRAATALAIAALRQVEPTTVVGWTHVDRGIEGFAPKLRALGANASELDN